MMIPLKLNRAPLGTIGRVYAEFGGALEGEALAAMARRLESRTKDRFGKHGSSLEDYGLNQSELLARFKPYIQDGKTVVTGFPGGAGRGLICTPLIQRRRASQ